MNLSLTVLEVRSIKPVSQDQGEGNLWCGCRGGSRLIFPALRARLLSWFVASAWFQPCLLPEKLLLRWDHTQENAAHDLNSVNSLMSAFSHGESLCD